MSSYFTIGRPSVGGVLDGLFSAGFTATFGGAALVGLYKISVVFGRGVDASLKGLGFDTSKKDSWAQYGASLIPARLSQLFTADVNYNKILKADVHKTDNEGEYVLEKGKKIVSQNAGDYRYSNAYLLTSGLAICLLSLTALELKNSLWRGTNPLLNVVLTRISPFKMELGQSWVAEAINTGIASVRSRIG